MSSGRDFEYTREFHSPSGARVDTDGTPSSSQGNSAPESWEQPTLLTGEPVVPRQLHGVQLENGVQPDPQEYRSAAFARMTARRQSTMSRLGSRILPNSVIRGLLNSEEETPAEGQAHRHGLVSRSTSRSDSLHNTSRFSPFGSLSSRGITRRRSTARAPYFAPRSDSVLNSDPPLYPTYFNTTERMSDPGRGSWRRSVRLHRVRNSLSSPISQMFGHQPSQNTGNSTHLPRPASSDDSDNLHPLPVALDTRMDITDPPHELDSVEPAINNDHSMSPVPSPIPGQGSTSVRRLPSLLRARSARVLRREEQTPLSRVLQLAATAIAAQLSGTTGPVLPNIQALGNGGLDGSLENFIQTLQNATSAQANPGMLTEGSSASENGSTPPVNFLRVFRFSNPETSRPSELSGHQTTNAENARGNDDRMDVDDSPEGSGGRTVTLVVVGVRSVPSGGGRDNEPGDAGPSLDALLGLPFLSPGNLPRNQEAGGNPISRVDGRPRATSRPFMGGPGGLFSNPDTTRQQGIANSSRRASDAANFGGLSSPPSVLSESPPGPHPPPSTPAESNLSAGPSGSSTPSRRLSTASALPHLHEGQSYQSTVEPEESVPLHRTRQRRRSDSEYARHRDLGSGAVRRNGVVEPDNSGPATGRSWLIYVVGTNLSENHPAFATPSLFTDNPTYEDMILLSSLLGPAKPPVATQSDVSSAGGLFRLVEYAGSLVAESLDSAGTIQVPEGERCLICLSDYEAAEELRQLSKCKHLYHKECIDQWLTTGRNSCPLCRGQGVYESSSNTEPAQEAAA